MASDRVADAGKGRYVQPRLLCALTKILPENKLFVVSASVVRLSHDAELGTSGGLYPHIPSATMAPPAGVLNDRAAVVVDAPVSVLCSVDPRLIVLNITAFDSVAPVLNDTVSDVPELTSADISTKSCTSVVTAVTRGCQWMVAETPPMVWLVTFGDTPLTDVYRSNTHARRLFSPLGAVPKFPENE